MDEPSSLEQLIEVSIDQLELASRRYPRLRTGQRDPIPPHVRILVLKRDGFRCDWCGSGGAGHPFHLDHIVPWSAGGSDDSTNLRTLCQGCNENRSNYRTDAAYTRKLPCTPRCFTCMGYRDVGWNDFDPDERTQVFCGSCNRISWVATGDYWRCVIV